ncbi:hypothetical protein [Clostridium intestinale]|uniref:hypothetical protein n=1 Tax=Clostridium intestinale TaxID=36845 RepID=UPI0028E6F44B|nr:hypothetical protein [Clostridium intestinale]WRY53179.1 hypothetical protein P8F83_08225 [Clostridium intestinale]
MKKNICLSLIFIIILSTVGCGRISSLKNKTSTSKEIKEEAKISTKNIDSTLESLDKVLDSLEIDNFDELDSIISNN